MKRTLSALLLVATALLGTAACTDDADGTSGESVTDNTEDQVPAPVPTQ